MLAAKLVSGWGVNWDIQWHTIIGRDSFWIPPHVMLYTGVTLVVLVSFGVLAWETFRARATGGVAAARSQRFLGLTGTRGFHVAAWGIAVTVLAAPIDDLWHRLFGLDVTLWSPPHLMGIVGAMINTIGCLLIAREIYPPASRARFAAVIITGAFLYSPLHRIVEPSVLIAYAHGGVRFYTYAMLSALFLPFALIVAARASGSRWAPILSLIVVVVVAAIGQEIARAGFAILQPVSVIQEEIAKDPTSDIAIANEIARKNGHEAGSRGLIWLGLIPAVLVSLIDPRRRPATAAMGLAVPLFALFAYVVGRSPALAPMVPGVAETLGALALTLAAALAGGVLGRWLAEPIVADGEREIEIRPRRHTVEARA